MSTKKGKFSKKDRYYMNLAINLAKNQNGLTGLNPSVGCVIVNNDKIVSFGATGINGRPHAESNALKKSKKKKYWIYCIFDIRTLFSLWKNASMYKSSYSSKSKKSNLFN